MVEELARRIDAMQNGTHRRDVSSDINALNKQTVSDAGVATQWVIEDLKTKVARLTEQTAEHSTQLNLLSQFRKKTIELIESQIIRWRYRLPELTDDEDTSTIVTVVEVQEQLNEFKELTRTKIHEMRLENRSLEAKLDVLERARSGSWELISNRVHSTLARTANALSDRMTEIEQMAQSQRTTPATDSSQPQRTEGLTEIESRSEARHQAFIQEVEKTKEDWDRAPHGQFEEVQTWSHTLEQVERQVKGLSSFAAYVDKFLEVKFSSTEGAPALARPGKEYKERLKRE